MDIRDGKTIIPRDVIFKESKFLSKKTSIIQSPTQSVQAKESESDEESEESEQSKMNDNSEYIVTSNSTSQSDIPITSTTDSVQ